MTDNKNDTSLTAAYKNAQGVVETFQNVTTMLEAALAQKVGWTSAAKFIEAHNPAYSTGTVTQAYNKGLAGYITPLTYVYGLVNGNGSQDADNGKPGPIGTINQLSKFAHDLARVNLTPEEIKNIQPSAEDLKNARDFVSSLPGGASRFVSKDGKTPVDPETATNDLAKIFAAVRMADAKPGPQTQSSTPPVRTTPQAAPVR